MLGGGGCGCQDKYNKMVTTASFSVFGTTVKEGRCLISIPQGHGHRRGSVLGLSPSPFNPCIVSELWSSSLVFPIRSGTHFRYCALVDYCRSSSSGNILWYLEGGTIVSYSVSFSFRLVPSLGTSK